MPSFSAVYEFGTFPDIDAPVDEPNILVNSLARKATREKKTWKGATTKATERVRYTDPIFTLSFDGFIGALAGLAIQHPGTSVASLANYADAWRGFDPDDGTLCLEDPEDGASVDEMLQTKFDVVQYSFVS